MDVTRQVTRQVTQRTRHCYMKSSINAHGHGQYLPSLLRRGESAHSVMHSLRSAGRDHGSKKGVPAAEVAPVGGAAREHGNKCQLPEPLLLLLQIESLVLHEAVCESPPSKRVAMARVAASKVSTGAGEVAAHAGGASSGAPWTEDLGCSSKKDSRNLKPKHRQPYLPSPLGALCDTK